MLTPIFRLFNTIIIRFRITTLYLYAMLMLWLCACSGFSGNGDYSFSEKSRKIQLEVGEIKEISLISRRDSSWQIIGSSENKEIVDVSSRQDPFEETATTSAGAPQPLVYLIKGVTAGRVRVVFAEKRKDETGPGKIRKTYLVDVVAR